METGQSKKVRHGCLPLHGSGTPGFKEARWGGLGNPGIWLYHLCSKIRRHSSGRGPHSSRATLSEHDSCGNVLRRRWGHTRRWRLGWRWKQLSIATIAPLLWILVAMGCKKPEQPLAARYAEAYSQLQSGELEVALKSAEQGFQQTQSTDPVWNYKFRMLKAETLVGQGRVSDALTALETDPPPELAGGEFSVRRRIIQSRVLCRIERFTEAEFRM